MTAEILFIAPTGQELSQEQANALPPNERAAARRNGERELGRRAGKRKADAEWSAKLEQASAQHTQYVAGMRSAQVEELDRHTKLIGKGAHRDGVLQGVFLGMLIAVGIGCLALLGYNYVMSMRVAIGRVPQASVPAITDTYQDAPYERGAREPASAN